MGGKLNLSNHGWGEDGRLQMHSLAGGNGLDISTSIFQIWLGIAVVGRDRWRNDIDSPDLSTCLRNCIHMLRTLEKSSRVSIFTMMC
jgi:hypothetical protein